MEIDFEWREITWYKLGHLGLVPVAVGGKNVELRPLHSHVIRHGGMKSCVQWENPFQLLLAIGIYLGHGQPKLRSYIPPWAFSSLLTQIAIYSFLQI